MAAGTVALIVMVSMLNTGPSRAHVAVAELITGLGVGLCVPILTNVVLTEVPAPCG